MVSVNTSPSKKMILMRHLSVESSRIESLLANNKRISKKYNDMILNQMIYIVEDIKKQENNATISYTIDGITYNMKPDFRDKVMESMKSYNSLCDLIKKLHNSKDFDTALLNDEDEKIISLSSFVENNKDIILDFEHYHEIIKKNIKDTYNPESMTDLIHVYHSILHTPDGVFGLLTPRRRFVYYLRKKYNIQSFDNIFFNVINHVYDCKKDIAEMNVIRKRVHTTTSNIDIMTIEKRKVVIGIICHLVGVSPYDELETVVKKYQLVKNKHSFYGMFLALLITGCQKQELLNLKDKCKEYSKLSDKLINKQYSRMKEIINNLHNYISEYKDVELM